MISILVVLYVASIIISAYYINENNRECREYLRELLESKSMDVDLTYVNSVFSFETADYFLVFTPIINTIIAILLIKDGGYIE